MNKSFIRILLVICCNLTLTGIANPVDSLMSIWRNAALPAEQRLDAALEACWNELIFDHPDSTLAFSSTLKEFASQHDLELYECKAIRLEGVSRFILGESEKAIQQLKDLEPRVKSLEEPSEYASLLSNLGRFSNSMGHYEDAREYYEWSLVQRRKAGDLKGESSTLNLLGNMYADLGDYPKSIAYYERSLELEREMKDLEGEEHVTGNIALVYKDMGDYFKAIEFSMISLKLAEEQGSDASKGRAYSSHAGLFFEIGDYEQATDWELKALEIRRKTQNQVAIAKSLNNLSLDYLMMGDTASAIETLNESIQIRQHTKDITGVVQAYSNLGIIYSKRGDQARADSLLSEAVRLSDESGSKSHMVTSYTAYADVQLRKGNKKPALEYANKALEMAEQIGAKNDMRDAAMVLYRIYRYDGNEAEALKYFELSNKLNNELSKESTQKKLIEQEFRYDFEKKTALLQAEQEKRDALAAEELRRKQIQRNGFIAGFSLTFLLALVFFGQRTRISKEKKRSDELLLNILPRATAEELKQHGQAKAKLHDEVTVLFTDFKGFTGIAEKLDPEQLVSLIHRCFSEFDLICEKYGIEKIKTIGDAYMAVAGLPVKQDQHALRMIQAAFEMRDLIRKLNEEIAQKFGDVHLGIRIGIHSGPVVAGVVGLRKFQYDVWGDTVNIASRMESSGESDKINVSGSTADQVIGSVQLTDRGEVAAKGKGMMKMFFAEPL